MVRAFGDAIELAGAHNDQSVIGGEGGVVGVNGVEGKIGRGWKIEDFCAGCLEFAAESFVLGLGFGEVGGVVEAEIAPMGCAVGLVPSGGGGRADKDALEGADHGVAVEAGLGHYVRQQLGTVLLRL